MTFKEEVIDIIAMVAENDIVKSNEDIKLFEEGILDSFAAVGLLMALQENLDLDLTITDFDRDRWATPKMIVNELEALK